MAAQRRGKRDDALPDVGEVGERVDEFGDVEGALVVDLAEVGRGGLGGPVARVVGEGVGVVVVHGAHDYVGGLEPRIVRSILC